jgi:hypothetical protein
VSSDGGAATVEAIEPLPTTSNAVHFEIDDQVKSPLDLDVAAGGTGSQYSAWNPVNSPLLFSPGLKISFFGQAAGCDPSLHDGAVRVDSVPAASALALQLAMAAQVHVAASAPFVSWAPARDPAKCAATALGGSSQVALFPSALLRLTASHDPFSGERGWLGPYGDGGQNGSGANAHITGTYVALRRPGAGQGAVHPWATSSGQWTEARVVVREAAGSMELGPSNGVVRQAQQSIGFNVFRPACVASQHVTAEHPCQLNFQFVTVAARPGITDWASLASWAAVGHVWFDPAQGGIPIVDGQVPRAGETLLEADTGLPLLRSFASSVQHGPTGRLLAYDVRISPAEFRNALTAVAARVANVSTAAVSQAQLDSVWGAGWDDPSSWVVHSVLSGQEIFNPDADVPVWIAGYLHEAYIGPTAP